MTGRVDSSERRVELLCEAVAINSVNPLQAGNRSGPGGEAALARWVAEQAEAVGLTAELHEVLPGRPNVYTFLPGAPDREVVIDVHLDTVGVEHMSGEPFDPEVARGRVHGRGSVDTKATLAVLLPLLGELGRLDPGSHPSIHLIGTIGEEAGGLPGAHGFREWADERGLRVDSLVVAEPTCCRPVHGHKGGVGLEMTVRGEAAHSSKPELGANAIVAAARIIEAFEDEHDRLVAQPPSTPVGTGTLSITEIAGGVARNIIPDRCEVYASRRVAPFEDPDGIFEELSLLARRAAAPLEVEIALANGRSTAAFYEEPTAPVIVRLAALAGTPPETATYGSNALAYRDIADQIVVFGPGSIDQAHKAVEWIEISELDRADAIYREWLTGG